MLFIFVRRYHILVVVVVYALNKWLVILFNRAAGLRLLLDLWRWRDLVLKVVLSVIIFDLLLLFNAFDVVHVSRLCSSALALSPRADSLPLIF